jgi:hypothetical protein
LPRGSLDSGLGVLGGFVSGELIAQRGAESWVPQRLKIKPKEEKAKGEKPKSA